MTDNFGTNCIVTCTHAHKGYKFTCTFLTNEIRKKRIPEECSHFIFNRLLNINMKIF